MFKMKQKFFLLLMVTILFLVAGCQAKGDDSTTAHIDIPDVNKIEAADPLSPILLDEDQFVSMFEPPNGYRYVVLSKTTEDGHFRNAVPVPEGLFIDDSCLAIAFQDVTPYLEEHYSHLMGYALTNEDNPDLEILDETSLSIHDTGVSENYVNNSVIVNDVVSTGTQLPKEVVRSVVESFALSFGPVSSEKLVLTTLTTDIGDFEVYIYEYEHNSSINMSKIGVFFPLGTNMHLLQVIQEGDINAPSPFMDAINAILKKEN